MAHKVHGNWQVYPEAAGSKVTPSIEFDLKRDGHICIEWKDKKSLDNSMSINGLGMVDSSPYPVNAQFFDGDGKSIAFAYTESFSVRKGCVCKIDLHVGLLTLERLPVEKDNG